ncbi:hypothetical protein LEMLEM_LOCUS77 [Lemmus lemmus]
MVEPESKPSPLENPRPLENLSTSMMTSWREDHSTGEKTTAPERDDLRGIVQ